MGRACCLFLTLAGGILAGGLCGQEVTKSRSHEVGKQPNSLEKGGKRYKCDEQELYQSRSADWPKWQTDGRVF